MNTNKIKKFKEKAKLTARQREIIIGKLLGDGHLESQNQGRTYRLKIEHSLKQKEYVDWLYEELRPLALTSPQTRTRILIWRGESRKYQKCWFNTASIGSLRFYAQQFYKGNKKIVPSRIGKLLTPLALAVWYMDDGSIKSDAHSAVLLNTHGFDSLSVKRLQIALEKKFGIKTKLKKQKDGIQIYLPSETIEMFKKLIEPFIIASMRYKLPKVWLT